MIENPSFFDALCELRVLMKSPNTEPGWKQHFPTYHFDEKDIAIEEYKVATKILEAEERLFLNAANFSVVTIAALGSVAVGSLDKLSSTFEPFLPELMMLSAILLLAFSFAVLLLRYFADRQKSIVFAARKVIVLRRMLGMSYGSLQLVLPNWRIEGADEPFSIKLFPGWYTYVAYPCYAIAGISAAVAFFILAVFLKKLLQVWSIAVEPNALLLSVTASWFVILCWIYRKSLLDVHERVGLIVVRWIARGLNLKIVNNFEYVIYRAILAKHELHRIGFDLSFAKKILIHVEDKEFYGHSGISLKGLVRLLLSILRIRRRAGGSTITQQLVRTLFIEDQAKLVRRKFIEILLAKWFDKVFSKTDQLDIYFASVRFESGVYGIAAAAKHFDILGKTHISPAEAFFLIERISNIRSRVLVEKIDQTLRSLVEAKVLNKADVREIVGIYQKATFQQKIFDYSDSLKRLDLAWQ